MNTHLKSLPSEANPLSKQRPKVVVSMLPPHSNSTTLKYTTLKL